MKTQIEKRKEHIQQLTETLKNRHNITISTIEMDKLRRYSITLRKLYECSCNGCLREKAPFESWKEYDNNRNNHQMPWIEKRIEIMEKRIDKKCKELNIPYYIQSDPRGCSLYLCTTNQCTYSTEGLAIY